jgi:hypothetical protein
MRIRSGESHDSTNHPDSPLVGRRLVREDCAEFTFDSVPPASYGLYGSVGRLRERVSVIEVRAGELWELWWVAPGAR